MLGHGSRRAGFGLSLLRSRQWLAAVDPRIQVPGFVAHGAGDGRMVRALSLRERALCRCGVCGPASAASVQAVPEGLQPVGVHCRRDCGPTGRTGRAAERLSAAQHGEPGPEIAPRTGRECRRGLCGSASRTAGGASPAAGRRRDDYRRDAAVVRRRDSAVGPRLQDQSGGAGGLAA